MCRSAPICRPKFLPVLIGVFTASRRTGLREALNGDDDNLRPLSVGPATDTKPKDLGCLGLYPSSLQHDAPERDIGLGSSSGLLGLLKKVFGEHIKITSN